MTSSKFIYSIIFSSLIISNALADNKPEEQGNKPPNENPSENYQSEDERDSKMSDLMQKLEKEIEKLKETIKKNWKEQEFDKLQENLEKLEELGKRKLESLGIITQESKRSKKYDPKNYPIRQFNVRQPDRYTIRKIEPPEDFRIHSRDQREWYHKPNGYGLSENLRELPKMLPENWQDFKEYMLPKDKSK